MPSIVIPISSSINQKKKKKKKKTTTGNSSIQKTVAGHGGFPYFELDSVYSNWQRCHIFSLSLSLSVVAVRRVLRCALRRLVLKKKLYFYFLLLLQPIGLIAFLSFFHISRWFFLAFFFTFAVGAWLPLVAYHRRNGSGFSWFTGCRRGTASSLAAFTIQSFIYFNFKSIKSVSS